MLAEVRNGVLVVRPENAADRAALADAGLRDGGDWCIMVLQARDERVSHVQQWPSRVLCEPTGAADELRRILRSVRGYLRRAWRERIRMAKLGGETVATTSLGEEILAKALLFRDPGADPRDPVAGEDD